MGHLKILFLSRAFLDSLQSALSSVPPKADDFLNHLAFGHLVLLVLPLECLPHFPTKVEIPCTQSPPSFLSSLHSHPCGPLMKPPQKAQVPIPKKQVVYSHHFSRSIVLATQCFKSMKGPVCFSYPCRFCKEQDWGTGTSLSAHWPEAPVWSSYCFSCQDSATKKYLR